MMGGLAVAWQVKVTLSPSRTERGSMDKVTMGGSMQEKQHMINVNVLSSGSSRTIDFSTQICHTNYKLNHKIGRFITPFHCLERLLLLYSRCGCSGIMKKRISFFLIENSNHSLLVNNRSPFLQGHDRKPLKHKRFSVLFRC